MATKPSKPVPATKKSAAPKSPKAVKPVKSTVKSASPVKKRATKAKTSKATASISLDPKPTIKEPVLSHDEISLRAYFIGERRQKLHWPGNPTTDWTDAVKQLRAEALEKPLKKR